MSLTARLQAGLRPYLQREPLAALALGISSGFPYAMIGATLTTRLAQDGIDKKSVTAFSLAFLVYNLKFLWAPLVDGLRLPLLGRLGQRVSWLVLAGTLAMAAVIWLALLDPRANLGLFAIAAVAVGAAGATYDIVIDAYRIETLKPEQLGVGSGMSQYGWRIGSVAAGSLALYVAARHGWTPAYLLCAAFALPAMIAGLDCAAVREGAASVLDPVLAANNATGIAPAIGAALSVGLATGIANGGDTASWAGVAMCLSAAACQTAVALLLKGRKPVPPLALAWWQCALGAAVLWVAPVGQGWPAWGAPWAWLADHGAEVIRIDRAERKATLGD